MAGVRTRSRWRYLGPAGGLLVALAATLVFVSSSDPAPAASRSILRAQDLSAHTTTTTKGAVPVPPRHRSGPRRRQSRVPPPDPGRRPDRVPPPPRRAPGSGSGPGRAAGSTTSTSTTAGSGTGTTATSTGSTATSTAAVSGCSGTSPPVRLRSGVGRAPSTTSSTPTSLDTSKWQPLLTATSGYTTGPSPSLVCYVDSPDTISESGGTLNLSVVQTATAQSCGAASTSYEGGMVSRTSSSASSTATSRSGPTCPRRRSRACRRRCGSTRRTRPSTALGPTAARSTTPSSTRAIPTSTCRTCTTPGSADPDPNGTGRLRLAGDTTAGQFNTYALFWTPTTITTYFNGVPCVTDVYGSHVPSPDAAPEPFNQPFFLAFTSALGMTGNDSFEAGTTPLPATM